MKYVRFIEHISENYNPNFLDALVPPLPSEEEPPGRCDSEEEDYSASVTAILQRRASSRSKGKRRKSFKDSIANSPASGVKNGGRRESLLSGASSAE